jgi:leucyl aminopeptidase (aminopeptidase T)
MLPAMRLDLDEVDRRVRRLAALLDAAESARLELEVDGRIHGLFLDLRHRTAHASSGLLRQAGAVGNLPSGEAYIVPYEGERPEEPSRSRGVLPIQFGDQVALLEIEHNRVVHVEGGGEGGAEWAERIRREPATANIAELGLGVLAELGIEPIGSTLLDEKLGLHIALGRSDHFGGAVGPGDFSAPEQVVHQDFVYLPATQPRVHVRRVDLDTPAGPVAIIRDDRYVVDFGAES